MRPASPQSSPSQSQRLISHGTARRVASERLDGHPAAVAFAATGEIRLADLLATIDARLAATGDTVELPLLRRYVEAAGARGPLPGW